MEHILHLLPPFPPQWDESPFPSFIQEGEDEYEKDGFIVDDIDEDEQDTEEEDRVDSDDEMQKKKKRKKRESEKNYVLDEDDYELLQDNNITRFRRPKVESKKGSDEEEEDGDIGEEEDEMVDFIVDEEEVDEHGEPTRRRKVNRKKSRQAPGVSSQALTITVIRFLGICGKTFLHGCQGERWLLSQQKKIVVFLDEAIARNDRRKGGINTDATAAISVVSDEEIQKLVAMGFDKVIFSAPVIVSAEAHDIFGDVDELLRQRTILSNKYKTEKGEYIREIDIPERIEISEESTDPPSTDKMSIEEESTWILHRLQKGVVLFGRGRDRTTEKGHDLAIVKDDIMRFLEFMHACPEIRCTIYCYV
ncbi:unnamed protein product [Lactuca virosa]|uniref:Spt6 acidic N-terminal domain-containing protein n=1 Tax=Lactuca virosa TaxID=75947 RepID=A0AAU9N4K9_9ASTR|nr:unnamed protein product [Lactuca virosa]